MPRLKPGKLKTVLQVVAVVFFLGGGDVILVMSYSAIYEAMERTRWTGKAPAVTGGVLVVLGMGPTPNNVIHDRTELAAELWSQGVATTVVTAGGQGADEQEPESTTLAKDLVARGVPAAAIKEESKSTSTFENLTLTRDLLAANNLLDRPVIIVTHDFHAARTEEIAQSLGLPATVVSASGPRLDGRFRRQAREMLAWVKWKFLGY